VTGLTPSLSLTLLSVLVQREMEFWDDEIGHKMDRLVVLVKD